MLKKRADKGSETNVYGREHLIHCRDDQGAGTAPVKRVFLVGYFLGLVQVQQVLALLPVCLYNWVWV